MLKKLKRFLLCLIAVSALSMSGTIYADDEEENYSDTEISENAENSEDGEKQDKSSKMKESVEKVELTEEQAENLLEYTGRIDGFDIYRVSKDYKDKIWEAHGGQPDKKAELTEKQQKEKELAEEEKIQNELSRQKTEEYESRLKNSLPDDDEEDDEILKAVNNHKKKH